VTARITFFHTARFVPQTTVPQPVKHLLVSLRPWFGFWLGHQLL